MLTRTTADALAIAARPDGHGPRRLRFVSVVLFDRDADRSLGTYTIHANGEPRAVHVAAGRPLEWCAAGYNVLRQRGEPTPRRAAPTAGPHSGLRIQGTRARTRAARRVFEGALAGHLRRRGATTTANLHGALGWFWLRLDAKEIADLVEASFRDGLIVPTRRPARVTGNALNGDEWMLTDRGRALTQARSLALRDLGRGALGIAGPLADKGDKAVKAIIGAIALAIPGAAALTAATKGLLAATLLFGVGLTVVLAAGVRGERDLHDAALAWPRLRVCRPAVYARYAVEWRGWPPTIQLYVFGYAILAAAALGLFGSFDIAGLQPIVSDWHLLKDLVGWRAAAIVAALIGWRVFRRRKDWHRYLTTRRAFHAELREREEKQRRVPRTHCAWGEHCPGDHPPGAPLTADLPQVAVSA